MLALVAWPTVRRALAQPPTLKAQAWALQAVKTLPQVLMLLLAGLQGQAAFQASLEPRQVLSLALMQTTRMP